jgi:hypothetical protein
VNTIQLAQIEIANIPQAAPLSAWIRFADRSLGIEESIRVRLGFYRTFNLRDLLKQVLAIAKILSTALRQLHRPGRSNYQDFPDMGFQLSDAASHSGRCHVQ